MLSSHQNPAKQIRHLFTSIASPAEQIQVILSLLSICSLSQMSIIVRYISQLMTFDIVSLIPHELRLMIFSYLDGSDLISASQVSRPWQSFTSDNILWRSVSRNAQVDLGLNARSLVDWRKQYCKWSKTESNLRNKKFSTQLIRARVSAVTFSQSTLLTSGDGNIMSWRADGKQLLLEKDLFIPSTLVSCMQCSDDTYLVSTTNDKLILMETGREPRFWDHPATTTMIYSHPVVCMAFGHV